MQTRGALATRTANGTYLNTKTVCYRHQIRRLYHKFNRIPIYIYKYISYSFFKLYAYSPRPVKKRKGLNPHVS